MKKFIYIFLVILTAISAGAVVANRMINEKINGAVLKVAALIEKRSGLDAEISNAGINFISFEAGADISLSKNGRTVFKAEGCTIPNVHRIYFFNERNIRTICKSSTVSGNDVIMLAKGFDLRKKERDTKEEVLHLESYQAEFVFKRLEFEYNEVSSFFSVDLKYSSGNGKITANILDNDSGAGLFEVLFDRSFLKTDILFDKIPLYFLKDTVSAMTGLKDISGMVDGFVNIVREESELRTDVDISIRDLTVEHPLIDWQPYKLSFLRFSGNVDADIRMKKVTTGSALVSLGGIDAVLSASYEPERSEILLDMKKVALNKLVTLVQDDVFKGYAFGGEIDLFVSYLKEGDEPPLFSVTGEVIDPSQMSERLNYLKEPFQYNFTDRNDEKISFKVGEANEDFIPFDLIPDHVVWAVVISEDAGFFKHKGIDFEEMAAALKDNVKKKKLRGGSTITQQIAKNLFLNREKTLLRKFREVILAIELDATLSKKRLLEIYFNIIEWAPGVFGLSNASAYYFGKPAYMLTPLEGAYLASVIPGPYKYHYQFKSGNIGEKWIDNLHRILNVMNETGHLTLNEYIDAVKEEIVFRPGD